MRARPAPVVVPVPYSDGLSRSDSAASLVPLADDDSPGSDGPRGDQAIVNVRIAVYKALNDGAIVCPPNENRSISRLGKRTCEDQVPAAMGFPSKR